MNINERIDRLIDLTARVESGGDYSAWNPDDNGHGPSFGLIQFSSTVGSLGKLIVAMQQAHPEWFRTLFGLSSWTAAQWGENIARSPHICRAALQLSGQVPIWQQCQRQLAREEYFDPAAKLCARFGLTSERAHAMAFDVAVQYGVAGLAQKLKKADQSFDAGETALLARLAAWADMHEYDQNRRHKLLSSPELSDAPLFDAPPPAETRPTLRRGDRGPAVVEALTLIEGHPPIGDFYGPGAESAVVAFQAKHGLRKDGIVGPKTWAALDRAAKEGGGEA